MPRKIMCCAECGSQNVLVDAYARWDVETQEWGVSSTFDKGAYCEDCDGETRIEEKVLKGRLRYAAGKLTIAKREE